ncbi:MAG TPA: FHA domain-containing protein [Acidimicrobiales bacterium]|nr:FHA domain-containing protein [Acidimicrobiales bacterium]
MPDSLLTVLRLLLLSLIWLFFVRVLVLLASKPRIASASAVAAPVPAAAPAPAASRSSGRASLRVVSSGAFANQEFTVGNEATLGRGQGCQVQLNDPMVSQLHARLFRSDRGLNIEDLGSTNGTYLNGRKVGGPTPLKKGDRVRVGPVELEVFG